MHNTASSAKPWLLLGWTLVALLAFAGNSIFARLALAEGAADPYSFTLIRLFSAGVMLALLLRFRGLAWGQLYHSVTDVRQRWPAALALFVYALCFSVAYVQLQTGTGALILFGSVQLAMLLIHQWQGHRVGLSEWTGMLVAVLGLGYLVAPHVGVPSSSWSVLFMITAGVAWAVYTLLGKHSSNPLQTTGFNFIGTLPLQAVLLLLVWLLDQSLQMSFSGAVWAILSGVVTSALGYAIWYQVLPKLPVSTAAVAQLSVPLIAAIGGLLFSQEPLSMRLMIAALLILGGIYWVIQSKQP